jgi:hypothetical protein
MLCSSGWRKTSRTWRRNSGRSSGKSTRWWASDTSPGSGTWPLAIRPTGEVLCGGATGPGGDDGPMGRGADTPLGANRERAAVRIQCILWRSGRGNGVEPRPVVGKDCSLDMSGIGGEHRMKRRAAAVNGHRGCYLTGRVADRQGYGRPARKGPLVLGVDAEGRTAMTLDSTATLGMPMNMMRAGAGTIVGAGPVRWVSAAPFPGLGPHAEPGCTLMMAGSVPPPPALMGCSTSSVHTPTQ